MKKIHSTLAAASLMLAITLTSSCTGDGGGDDEDSSSSNGVSSSSGGALSSSGGNNLLLYFTSDYMTEGVLRWMNTNATSLNPPTDSLEGFNQDSKVFAYDGKIFILERPYDTSDSTNGGILNCFNPPSSSSGKPVRYGQQQLAHRSNPYDIAFIGDKGYIAQYDEDSIQIFNVGDCSLNGKIPLPNVLDGDTSSRASQNAASIKANGNTLLVVMQRWNLYPYDTVPGIPKTGVLLRIDAPSKTLLNRIDLNYYNPQSSVLKSDGTLYIASAFDLMYGIRPDSSGIEYVTSTGNTSTPLVNGTSTGLGGGPTNMVLDSTEQILYTTVYISYGNAPVKRVPISGSTPFNTLPGIVQSVCLAYDKDIQRLFVGDGDPFSGSTTPSLKFYTSGVTSTVSLSTPPALAPYSLAILRY